MDKILKEVETATHADIKILEERFPRGAISGIIESHPELLPKGRFNLYLQFSVSFVACS